MGLVRVTPPQGDVIPLEELRRQVRVDHADEDDDIRTLAAGVVSFLEGDGTGLESCWLGRVLLPQSWALTLDAFPARAIMLPIGPVIAVESITYIDADGDAQEIDSEKYRLLADRLPAEIVPAFGESWPLAREEEAVITVTFRAGYAGGQELDSPPGPSAVPKSICQAIKLIVAHWYANRETVNIGNIVNNLPWAAEALLTPQRTALSRLAWSDRP
ncbi:head-tail connector protein [Dongia sp.]|uniref:head-tail connector protein n=1 Tax=Dongia sp. TaxID=1977262 RepID=UPI0035AFA30A